MEDIARHILKLGDMSAHTSLLRLRFVFEEEARTFQADLALDVEARTFLVIKGDGTRFGPFGFKVIRNTAMLLFMEAMTDDPAVSVEIAFDMLDRHHWKTKSFARYTQTLLDEDGDPMDAEDITDAQENIFRFLDHAIDICRSQR